MSLAYDETVTPIRPNLRVVESRVADTENGFIMLAMELYEELIGANLTKNQAKVAHAVCRKTYGFKKKMDRIADSQLAELCRISRPKANIAKNELIGMNVILSEGGRIGPNKNISEWKIPESSLIGNIVTKKGTESVTSAVTPIVTKTGTHKRNTLKIKENSNTPLIPQGGKTPKFNPLDIPIPEWLDITAWTEWVQYRGQSKKPIKTAITVTKAFSLLKECLDEGHDPAEVINTSIANGYQGLFKPKYPVRKVGVAQPAKPMNHIPEGFQ